VSDIGLNAVGLAATTRLLTLPSLNTPTRQAEVPQHSEGVRVQKQRPDLAVNVGEHEAEYLRGKAVLLVSSDCVVPLYQQKSCSSSISPAVACVWDSYRR